MRVAKKVVVLDYGSGNLRSAQRALERVGATVEVTADRAQAVRADGLVVPGVGAYAACMAGLQSVSGGSLMMDRIAVGAPILGICVGMQILCDTGEEHGVVTKGLGVIPGVVSRLAAPVVPHMGWNTVTWPAGSRLGAGLDDTTRMYFVHSYALRSWEALTETGAMVAVTRHTEDFVSAVEHNVVSATQFHPEKSGDAGAVLLANWVAGL